MLAKFVTCILLSGHLGHAKRQPSWATTVGDTFDKDVSWWLDEISRNYLSCVEGFLSIFLEKTSMDSMDVDDDLIEDKD